MSTATVVKPAQTAPKSPSTAGARAPCCCASQIAPAKPINTAIAPTSTNQKSIPAPAQDNKAAPAKDNTDPKLVPTPAKDNKAAPTPAQDDTDPKAVPTSKKSNTEVKSPEHPQSTTTATTTSTAPKSHWDTKRDQFKVANRAQLEKECQELLAKEIPNMKEDLEICKAFITNQSKIYKKTDATEAEKFKAAYTLAELSKLSATW